MSERQHLEAMLSRVGIEFKVEECTDERREDSYAVPNGAAFVITVESNTQWPQSGYGGFYTEWWFDVDGALIGVASWE